MAESLRSLTIPALALEKTAGGSLRRHSTGKASSLNTREYVPHYLRASTGSCHDLCKYGKHIAEESQVLAEKKKRSTLARSKHLSNGETYVPDPTERSFQQSRKKALLVKVKSLPISRTCLSDRLNVSKLKTHVSDISKVKKYEVTSSDRGLSLKSTSKAEDSNIKAKHATSMKPKSPMMKLLQSTNAPRGGLSGRRNSDIKVGETARSNGVGLKKIVMTSVTSPRHIPSRVAISKPRKQWNLKIASPRNMKSKVKQHDQDEAQEKILYVITKETENLPSESDKNDCCENKPHGFDHYGNFAAGLSPPSPSTEEEKVKDEDGEDSQEEPMCIETTMSLDYKEMAKKLHSEDTIEHEKLNFRRGKVVDNQSEYHNGPMRLKFRRGRSLEENQKINADAVSRSFRPREIEGETNNSEAGSEQVVLRHQHVKEKKDAKGLLLNNVIEETASKLGGIQKSKVKALVGAFETVISLQVPKPLATTVN